MVNLCRLPPQKMNKVRPPQKDHAWKSDILTLLGPGVTFQSANYFFNCKGCVDSIYRPLDHPLPIGKSTSQRLYSKMHHQLGLHLIPIFQGSTLKNTGETPVASQNPNAASI